MGGASFLVGRASWQASLRCLSRHSVCRISSPAAGTVLATRVMPTCESSQELQVSGSACRSQHGEQAMCWGPQCSWWRLTACACCTLGTTRVLQTDTCLQLTCPRPRRIYVRSCQSPDITLHPISVLPTCVLCVMLFGGNRSSQRRLLSPVKEGCAGAAAYHA